MAKKRTVRQRVRLYCAEHDITQRQLASQLGISEPKMSRILSGHCAPSIHELARLEALIGLTARDFAGAA
jgi:transcriptional regulator with XRE-family HTH domain